MTNRNTDDISRSQCDEFRNEIRNGETISSISKNTDNHWRRIQTHIIGECDHDGQEDPLTKEEAYARFPVTADDCRELRSLAKDSDDILGLSDEVVWDYQTILRHVRGYCQHSDLKVAPLEKEFERRQNVTIEECEDMRNRYFDERESIKKIADSFSVSYQATERHIKFLCPHEDTSIREENV